MGSRTRGWMMSVLAAMALASGGSCGGVAQESAAGEGEGGAPAPEGGERREEREGDAGARWRFRWVAAGGGEVVHCANEHSATAIGADVLVVGMCVLGPGEASALRYHPESDTFELAGAEPATRSAHAAVRLLDGRVLVTGGHDASWWGLLSSVALFDPGSGSWTAGPPMPEALARHTATRLSDGRVLVAGGTVGFGAHGGDLPTASAAIFDPAAGSWSPAAPMSEARTHHAAVALGDGRVLVVGGAESGGAETTAEIYDPEGGSWQAVAPWENAFPHPTATVLGDGRVLVVAGERASVLDPVTETWGVPNALAHARSGHAAALLLDGRVLVAGGLTSAGPPAEVYDPARSVFEVTAANAGWYWRDTLTLLAGGDVLAVGVEGAERYVREPR